MIWFYGSVSRWYRTQGVEHQMFLDGWQASHDTHCETPWEEANDFSWLFIQFQCLLGLNKALKSPNTLTNAQHNNHANSLHHFTSNLLEEKENDFRQSRSVSQQNTWLSLENLAYNTFIKGLLFMNKSVKFWLD